MVGRLSGIFSKKKIYPRPLTWRLERLETLLWHFVAFIDMCMFSLLCVYTYQAFMNCVCICVCMYVCRKSKTPRFLDLDLYLYFG